MALRDLPILHGPVMKKDNTTRFVVDYQQLNDLTVKDSYPMPNIREIIDKTDMANAYWAVPIREEDLEKTAFLALRKLYEMCVTAYGLCNSQATYQRTMDSTLDGVQDTDSFINNVCSHAALFDQMLSNLREVFERFRKANLQMRIDKCKFGYYDIDFVGHNIPGQGVKPIYDNVEATVNFSEPRNLKELVRFIGMAGYYREFIPHMARIIEPLNRLRRHGEPFHVKDEHREVFEQLKRSLASSPVLVFLEADACDVSVGGTSSKLHDLAGVLQPTGYYSSALVVHQRNYSPEECKCWSLVKSSRKWRTYCRAASKAILIEDHNTLEWFRAQKGPRGKFARWLIELEELPYKILYKNRSDHTVPDCISRAKETEVLNSIWTGLLPT